MPGAHADATQIVRLFILLLALGAQAFAQQTVRPKSAVVVLSGDRELRQEMEDAVAAKAVDNNYTVVASYSIVPDVDVVNSRAFARTLAEQGVQAVLMLRPSAVGPGSSLAAVRGEVSPEMYRRMREFAGEVSDVGSDDSIAVVHLAIYTITSNGAVSQSSGAVWLDEEVESRDVGVERLHALVRDRVNAVRPAIRQHLGLPPLR